MPPSYALQRLAMLPVCSRRSASQAVVFSRAQVLPRTYASTTKGDSQNATSLATDSPKPSDSATEGDIKSSRATEGAPPEHGGSVAKPVTDPQTTGGTDEEGGDPVKQDPDKSAEQKRKRVESQQKPLDAADK